MRSRRRRYFSEIALLADKVCLDASSEPASRAHLASELSELCPNGVGPDAVAFCAKVQIIRHDLPRHLTIGGQESIANVEVVNPIPVVELSNECVDLPVVGIRPAVSARENRQEQHLGLRGVLVNRPDDLPDTGRNLLRRIAIGTRVIRADHQDHDLRSESVKFTVLHAPQQILGAISRNAEIGGGVAPVFSVDEGLVLLPAGRDRVAEKHHMRLAALTDPDKGPMESEESCIGPAITGAFQRRNIRAPDGSVLGRGLPEHGSGLNKDCNGE